MIVDVYVRCARRQVRAFFRKEDSSLPAIFLSGTRYRGKGRKERERERAKKDENMPRSGGKDEQLSFRPPSSLEKGERRDGG